MLENISSSILARKQKTEKEYKGWKKSLTEGMALIYPLFSQSYIILSHLRIYMLNINDSNLILTSTNMLI